MNTTSLLRNLALWVATVLALSGCGGGQEPGATADPLSVPTTESSPQAISATTAKQGILAISTSPRLEPFPTSSAEYDALKSEADALAYGAGARGQIATFTWRELEPRSGSYDEAKLAQLQAQIDAAKAKAMVQYVGIQVINTYVKELPEDLAGLAFDDVQVITRFRALLKRIVGANIKRIRYLSIGNEVDVYLASHAAELAPYKAFYRDAARTAHALDPAIQVGVTGSGAGALGSEAAMLSELNAAGSDVVMLTYYPMQSSPDGNASVRDPSAVAGDITRLLSLAGRKPLVLQEVGYPVSSLNGSSEASQAEFMRQIFKAWSGSNGRIPFVNFFLLHDFPDQLCSDLLAYYGLPNGVTLKASLCSLGLRTVDGTARQAWATLVDEMKKARLP